MDASPGGNEAMPVVHNGVTFLGQYARLLPPEVDATNKRNISIYGNKGLPTCMRWRST
jgi:hypothetical protein